MKVILYATSTTRSAGGLLPAMSGLARAMEALGARVTVVGGADQHFDADRAAWGDVSVITHDSAGAYGLNGNALGLIAAERPDIVHINGIWSAASIYGAVNALRGRSVVVSPHGMLDPWILARKPAIKQIHSALFERPMLRRAYVHALNESERDSVVAFMPELADRTFILPNGIDDITPIEMANRTGALYLSRLHEKKQTLELIEAWSALGRAETLTVAGWGDPNYEQQVARAAAATQTVNFVGPLYGEAKARAFEAARFFILPSLSEGLPMAVLEALQHGCVPIITDACNLPELFADDIALRMRPDFSDFAAVTASALAMSDTAFAARSAAARVYSRRYLWSEIARAMLAKYEAILGAKGRAT